jgi:hypothetical protein
MALSLKNVSATVLLLPLIGADCAPKNQALPENSALSYSAAL